MSTETPDMVASIHLSMALTRSSERLETGQRGLPPSGWRPGGKYSSHCGESSKLLDLSLLTFPQNKPVTLQEGKRKNTFHLGGRWEETVCL